MGGGFASKPGGASLVQPVIGRGGAGGSGPGKQTLTGQLGSGPATGAAASQPPDPARRRRMMELYLALNQTQIWNTVGDHARSVDFPDPHARLTWIDQRAFVRELMMQLEANVRDFTPLAALDEILYPSNAARTIGALLPPGDAWSPPLGLAIAQALQIAIVSSLHRLGPRYLAVADAGGATGGVNAGALTCSMPIDRYVGAAMCAPRVLAIEPPDPRSAAKSKSKPTAPRTIKLAWEGERDPQLWNWVRATEPIDATAEEVAAALWTVTDHHGETRASFNAYLLVAAPPLFGIPKRFAIKHPDARQYAPSRVLASDDSVAAELVAIANSSASDGVALHQSPPPAPKDQATLAEPPAEQGAILALVGDCKLQLDFMTAEVAARGFAGHVAPALAFVGRKTHELATADARTLADWRRVIAGQRDRLFKISGAIHNLTGIANKLGVKDPKAPDAAPIREILELLATAAGTSHLAQTSDAKLQQALELQAGLNARAVQATERELEGAHLDFAATMGSRGTRSAGGYSTEIGDLQQRSRRLQTTMINGGEVDPAEVDEVTLRSGEIALRERVLGTIHSTFELQEAAMAAKDGLAAHIAMLFSGKFRSLEAVCETIRSRVVPIQGELIAAEQQIRAEAHTQVTTPALAARHRATRRAVLARAQVAFTKIAADADLQHFFREGAKIVQSQQFRTACVKAAALIGIAVLAAATGGIVAELAGSMLMEAGGVATVAELSTVARVGITAANLVTDSAVNAAGQTAIQGGSLTQAFVENLFMSFASTALFGTIARASAETARLEGREAMTWARANTIAQKAFVAGREVGTITVHTVWGAAIGYVAHRVTGGHEPSPMEARDWLLQGASVAIGRGVHQAIGARMPGLERLARRHAAARRLVHEAQQLQQLASKVEHSKDPAAAVDLLDQRTQLLREEIEAIEHIVAKDGDASGELGKLHEDLEREVRESTTQAMLDTKLHLLGLEELVPGALWKGSTEQVQHAIKEARAHGGKVSPQDPHSKRWKLTLDGHEVQIQEMALDRTGSATAIVGPDPRDRQTVEAPHHRGGRYGVAGDQAEEAVRDPHPSPEMREIQERARHAYPEDIEAQKDFIFKQFRSGVLRAKLLSRRTGDVQLVSRVLQDFGVATASRDVVARVFDYVFDSSGIGFHYESYAAWNRLVAGRGTVADARFFVHEAAEIGIMERDGVDFMGKSVAVNTRKHEQWFNETFQPAYSSAHAKALYVEYQFLAEQMRRVVGDGTQVPTPEVIAAFDPVSDEGRLFMVTPGGAFLRDRSELSAWVAHGSEQVNLSPSIVERLGAPTKVTLAELVRLVRNEPITSTSVHGAKQ